MIAEAPPLMRPAARSAAVRPHSSSSSSPRPVSAASPCPASLFFVPSPRPIGKQSCLVAVACSHADWEHGRGWERVWEPECWAISTACATVPTVPGFAPARVMRLRPRAPSFLSLSLGTWKQSWIVFTLQEVSAVPAPVSSAQHAGTWEQGEASAPRSDWLQARRNKIGAGNGDLQLAGGGARRKFRGSIARSAGGDQVELGRIQQLPTRRGGNGGFLPFSSCAIGPVGTAMLEGCGQAAENAGDIGACRKLGRLSGLALGSRGAGELEQLALGAPWARSAARAPGAPNRAADAAAMLALHARRIWIEVENEAVQAGLFHDRSSPTVEKIAQTGNRRRGPGGIRFSNGRKAAVGTRNCEAGKRAGVNPPAAIARPHETGEVTKLRRHFSAVNGAAA